MKKLGSKAKLRQYFLENIGRVLTSEELYEASGRVSEWARRVRELRNEEGFEILTHNDRSELKPGEYLLLTETPRPAFARQISKELRSHVLTRNGFTCQMCGAGAGEPSPYNPSRKVRLHIGHILDKSHGGTDDPSNLRALCSDCNEGASNITQANANERQVLALLRKSPRADQLRVLQFLMRKFPEQSQELLDNLRK